MQQIWKTQQWPQDWKRSVFIPNTKKGNAKECSNYCTIALILLNRFSRVRLCGTPSWGGPQEGVFWGCIPQAAVSWPGTAEEQPPARSAGLMTSLGGQEIQGGGGGGAELPVGMELRLRAPGGGSHLL